MSVDVQSTRGPVAALPLVPYLASADGPTLDVFETAGIMFTANVGTITDGTHNLNVQDSLDGLSWDTVPPEELQGAFVTLVSDTTQKVGYRCRRPFVRVQTLVTGGPATGGLYDVTADQAGPGLVDFYDLDTIDVDQGVDSVTPYEPAPGEYGQTYPDPGSAHVILSPGAVRGQPNEPDSTEFTFSMWFRLPATMATLANVIGGRILGLQIWAARWSNSGTLTFSFLAGTMNVTSTDQAALLGDGLWHHLSCSGNTTANRYSLYIDGVDEKASDSGAGDTATWENPANNADNHTAGSFFATNPAFPFLGDLAEIYMDPQHEADLSVLGTRERFRTAAGLAGDLGERGTVGTGFTPAVYYRDGDPKRNAGRWGPFTFARGITSVPQVPLVRIPGPNA